MRFTNTLALALLTAALAAPFSHAAPPSTDWKEKVSPDEASIFAALPGEFNTMQQRVADDAGISAQRGLHNKSHLAVKGELKVIEGIPELYRQGFFKTPATYQAWLRFSNGQGAAQEDRRPDLRGLAVKILDVPGENLTASHSFDIVTNNFPAQPARDINQFMSFLRDQGNILTLPLKLARDLGWAEAKRILGWAANNLGTRITSLATINFFTGLPLQYGPYACHIRLKANNGAPPAAAGSGDRDYLKWDLRHRLATTGLKYDVEVQLYTDAVKTPIEDASIVWQESDAPFVKVAELTVTPRDIEATPNLADEETGNGLLWNPWHAPKEHRPLGQLMRARRVVYPGSGKFRGARDL